MPPLPDVRLYAPYSISTAYSTLQDLVVFKWAYF